MLNAVSDTASKDECNCRQAANPYIISNSPSQISNLKSQMLWVGEKVTWSRSLSRWTAPKISSQKRVKWSNRRGCDSFRFSYIVNFFPVALLNPQWLIIEDLRTPKKQTVSFNSYWGVKADVFFWNKPGLWKPWCPGVLLITNNPGLRGRLLNCHSLFLHISTTYPQWKQHSTIEVEQVFVGKKPGFYQPLLGTNTHN